MPSFDPALDLDLESVLEFQYADALVVTQGLTVLQDGVEIDPTALLGFGDTFYTFAPNLLYPSQVLNIEDLLEVASYLLLPPSALSIFFPGQEIVFSDLPYLPGDTGEVLRFDELSEVKGLSMAGTEILYPVIPVSEVNKSVFPLDSEEWRATQKAATVVPRTVSTLRFRIDTAYLATFLADLDSKRTSIFRLTTAGYCPFGGSSEDNYVRVLGRTRPQREDRGLTQLVEVTFRFMATYP